MLQDVLRFSETPEEVTVTTFSGVLLFAFMVVVVVDDVVVGWLVGWLVDVDCWNYCCWSMLLLVDVVGRCWWWWW